MGTWTAKNPTPGRYRIELFRPRVLINIILLELSYTDMEYSCRSAVAAIQHGTSRASTPPTEESGHGVHCGVDVEIETGGRVGSDFARPPGQCLLKKSGLSTRPRAPRGDVRAVRGCHAWSVRA